MCHEYDDNEPEQQYTMDMIPEEEREEFITYACTQFENVIETAEGKDILYELITEWPREKQALFALTTFFEGKLQGYNE